MMDFNFLTIFFSSAILADKRHVAPKLNLTNVAALNYLLRFEIFVSKNRQLRVGDSWLPQIDVLIPYFLTRKDLPSVA